MALVIGQKYVPHSKTRGVSLANCRVWEVAQKKKQPFLYYTGFDGVEHRFYHTETAGINGDFFNESDVIPYVEPPTTLHQAALNLLTSRGMKVGSKVKVMFKVPSHTGGWSNGWTEVMDSSIGKIGVVTSIDEANGVGINIGIAEFDGYKYPSFCLELVESTPNEVKLNDQYTAVINFDSQKVKVGCQEFSFNVIEELATKINQK